MAEPMRVAGVREFRSSASRLVNSDEIVFITRHGKLSSILVPMTRPEDLPADLRRELLERLGQAIDSHLRSRGISEAQVKRDFEAWRKARRARRRGR